MGALHTKLALCLLLFVASPAANLTISVKPARTSSITRRGPGRPQEFRIANTRVLVGVDVRTLLGPWSFRALSILVESREFSIAKVEEVFRCLAAAYPDEECLSIWACNDFRRLETVLDSHQKNASVPWDELPGTCGVGDRPKPGPYAEYSRHRTTERIHFYPLWGSPIHLDLPPADSAASADEAFRLIDAATFGDIEVVKQLIEGGTDPNIRSQFGSGALAEAALRGETEVVSYLLQNGADVNQRTSAGWTTLMCAVRRNNNVDLLKLLFDRDPDVTLANDDGLTALAFAARNRELEIARELVKRGADPLKQDVYGRSAVTIAGKNGHEEMSRLFKTSLSGSRE